MYATVDSNRPPARTQTRSHTTDRAEDPVLRPARHRSGAATHVGLVRLRNEDAWRSHLEKGVFVVCDGMGGHNAGDVASQLGAETVSALTADLARTDDVPARLSHALWRANMNVFMAGDRPEHYGMGTTAVALWVGPNRAVVAHVGDSRAYRLRDGELEPLTLDHSPVGDAVRQGRIDQATAESCPPTSIITRSLGASVDVAVECAEFDAQPGDRFLLCTDGLTDLVPLAEIQALLGMHQGPEDTAHALVFAALDEGGHDNVTALVVDVL